MNIAVPLRQMWFKYLNSAVIQVEVTAKFKRYLQILAKKYRSIRNDIQPIIEQLQSGELPGDQISGIG
ncbi:hypothetical protein [Nostoc sp.]|uniref:hypothetical protein n=1 Tax=Nostoc sp. TaxID=1180 RepID=UPI002FF96B36